LEIGIGGVIINIGKYNEKSSGGTVPPFCLRLAPFAKTRRRHGPNETIMQWRWGEGVDKTERRWTVRARRGDDDTGGEKTAVVLVVETRVRAGHNYR